MPSWYDIQISGTRDIETLAGFPEARDYFVGLLTSLSKCGRPLIAGGFSQGGAMALSSAFSTEAAPQLSGVLAISTYAPTVNVVDKNKNVPLLWLHGDADDVIPSAQGKRSFDALVASGLTGATWKGYSRLGHSIDQRTIRDVDEFLERVGAAADKK